MVAASPCVDAVQEADPDEVSRGFGIARQRCARGDRRDPRPAGGEREGAELEEIARVAGACAKAPHQKAREDKRCQAMGPQPDHRAIIPPDVNFADMATGVAKLYK
jgi:hypothetical protein